MTIPKFSKYVCIDDSVSWSVEGFDIVATLHQDTDTRPTDFDCYDDAQIEAWRNDEWFYGGVVLSVSRNGVELTDHAASLWGIDCNLGDDNDYLSEVCADLQDEALEQARADHARIINALGARTMRTNEHDAKLPLQPLDRKPCRAEAVEHYRPGGDWVAVRWCLGVIVGGALLGFVAGVLSAYL